MRMTEGLLGGSGICLGSAYISLAYREAFKVWDKPGGVGSGIYRWYQFIHYLMPITL